MFSQENIYSSLIFQIPIFFYYHLFLLLVWGIPVACKKLNTQNMNVLGSKELHRKIGHVMEQIFENVLWGYKVLESCHLGGYLSLGMTNGFQWVATHINWWLFPGLLCWEGFRGLLNSLGKKSASYVCPGHEFCHLFYLAFLVYILSWHETHQGLSIKHCLVGFWTNVPKLNQVQEWSQSESNLCWVLTLCCMLWKKQICRVKWKGKTLNSGKWSGNNNCVKS